MKYKFLQQQEKLYANYWFIPLILAVSTVILALLTEGVDRLIINNWLQNLDLINEVGPEGARSILSIIASSVITITSVSFSITILTLSIAQNQLGQRLLPNFMRQGKTQFVLGTFIGTFIYCLLIIRTIVNGHELEFVPYLSLTIALLLGIFSFFVLIYFINYVAQSIIIYNILDYLTKDAMNSFKRQLVKIEEDREYIAYQDDELIIPKSLRNYGKIIASHSSGFIQAIDYPGLHKYADDNDLLIQCLHKPGHHLIEGSDIYNIYAYEHSDADHSQKLNTFLSFGNTRTTIQDLEYALEEIVEIALRALSPGVNAPFTAIYCIDKLAEALVIFKDYYMPLPYAYSDNKLRVIIYPFTHQSIIHTCFNSIRQHARDELAVLIHLLETFEKLIDLELNTCLANTLYQEAKIICEQCQQADFHPSEKAIVEARFVKVKQKFQSVPHD